MVRNAAVIHVGHESIRQLTCWPVPGKLRVLPAVPFTVCGVESTRARQDPEEATTIGLSFAVACRAVPLNHIPSDRSSLLGGLDAIQHIRSEEHTSELQSPCNLVCR